MKSVASAYRRRIKIIGLGVVTACCLGACQSDAPGDPGPNQDTQQDAGDPSQEDTGPDTGDSGEDADAGDAAPDTGGETNGDSEPEPDADQVDLASDGEAKLSVVVAEDADSKVMTTAEELANYLEAISAASFDVEYGDGTEGIVVGEPDDFDALPFDDVAFGNGSFEREDYILRTKKDHGVYLLGSTPLAVEFAAWDLLYRLGHRQFFPTDTWEIIPETQHLSVAVDVLETPDYYNRQAPRGAMRMDQRPWGEEAWHRWQIRNRTAPTFTLNTAHVYDTVISNNQSAFDANPEYWGLVDGQRTSDAQPNVAHEDVQQMFIDHAINRFESDPSRDSVAMDPRDGNRWSESDESLAIGGPSEQAVNLANLVAQKVVDEFGHDKYVGMYGYSHHSPPPEIDAHPNVIVSLATDYIRGGYTFEEMIDGWSERTNMIGIREYYAIGVWNQSLPGHGAKAADTEYLQDTIPHFHDRGARFMNAESNDTWGGYGLGYYLAARMLWDVEEAARIDELIDDFVEKSFGPAHEPMRDFYELIDGSSADPYSPQQPRPLNDDMVGRMYRALDEARDRASDDDEILARIDDLVLYTHYVELYREFDAAEGAQRQESFDEVVSFAWRIRDTMMVDSVELVRDINRIVRTDDDLSWAPGRTATEPSDIHRVDEDEPFTDGEIEHIVDEGIANHDLIDFDMEPWDDSGQLEPAGFAPDTAGGPVPNINRGNVEAVVYTDDGTLPALTLSAGYIYDNFGPLRWSVKTEDGAVVDEGEVPPDEQDRHVELNAPEPGIYRLSITNTGQGFEWDYDPRGAHMTMLASGVYKLGRNWYDRLYFYVPEGKEDIYLAGTMMEGRYDFVDGDGNIVDGADIDVIQGYTRVDVPPGQDGSVWSLELTAWRPAIQFLNIPGYVAFSPDELMLPQEVVDGLP